MCPSSATLARSLARGCLLALGAVGGCSAPAVPTAPLAPVAPSLPAATVTAALPDPADTVSYVALQAPNAWRSLPRSYLSRGRRITAGEGEHLIGPDRAWERFFEVPAIHGGGFLLTRDIHDEPHGTHRASTFTGPTTLTTDLVARSVSFGAGHMMFRDRRGARQILPSPTGTVKLTSLPLGVQDMVGSADGTRGLLLLDGGAVFATTDSGASYLDVTSKLGGAARRLVTSDADPAVAFARGGAVFKAAGDLVASSTGYPSPADRAPRAREEGLDGSHETAALQGVLVEPNVALVYHRARPDHELRWVDLVTNKVLRQRKILDGVRTDHCLLHGLASDVLLLCRDEQDYRLVYQVKTGGVLVREQKFAPELPFYADHRGIVFPWRCDDEKGVPRAANQHNTACVRKGPGEWVTVDVGPHLGRERTVVMRWIPTRTSAVAVVRSPAIGDHQKVWLIDPGGQKTEVDASLDFTDRSVHALLSLDFSIAEDGALQGWPVFRRSQARAKAQARGAEEEALPFTVVKTSGRFALAQRQGGQIFVSRDWGTTFTPTEELFPTPPTCGNLGCSDGTLLRLGWAPRQRPDSQSPPANGAAPANGQPPTVTATAPVAAPRSAAPLPTLRCKRVGSPRVKRLYAPSGRQTLSGSDQVERTPGLGARLVVGRIWRDVKSGHGDTFEEAYPQALWAWDEWHPHFDDHTIGTELAAMAIYRAPDGTTNGAAPTDTIDLAWVHPFDPGLTISEGKLLRTDLSKAWRAGTGGDVPLDDLGYCRGSPMPVLANKGPGYGLLLQDSVAPIWLPPGNAKVEVIPLGHAFPDHTIVSASALGGALTLLLEHHGATLAVEARRGTVTEKLRIQSSDVAEHYPANPDALAHAPDGSLAVIRLRSHPSPPSLEDPAFLLKQGSPPTPLPPWSTLTPLSDPLCKGAKGHRAILHTDAPWVRVTLDGDPVRDLWQILADVIWTPQRVCLIAARVGVDRATSMVSSYSATRPRHALNTVGSGNEERQTLTCELTLE